MFLLSTFHAQQPQRCDNNIKQHLRGLLRVQFVLSLYEKHALHEGQANTDDLFRRKKRAPGRVDENQLRSPSLSVRRTERRTERDRQTNKQAMV